MKRNILLGSILVLCLALTGCVTPPQPPPEDFYIALAESSVRWSAYIVARNNLEEALIAKIYLDQIDPEYILTYQGWIDMLDSTPLPVPYKLAILDAIGLARAYMPNPEENLTPLAKKIIKAVIRGGISGVNLALSERY